MNDDWIRCWGSPDDAPYLAAPPGGKRGRGRPPRNPLFGKKVRRKILPGTLNYALTFDPWHQLGVREKRRQVLAVNRRTNRDERRKARRDALRVVVRRHSTMSASSLAWHLLRNADTARPELQDFIRGPDAVTLATLRKDIAAARQELGIDKPVR